VTTGFILEVSDTDKDPAFFGQTKFGVGPQTLSGQPMVLLLVGMKATGLGTLTANTQVAKCASPEDADTIAGAGGELARMARKALQIQGIEIYLAAPAVPGGATAATATITIAGSMAAASNSEWRYRIAGDYISGGISSSDTPTTVAAAIVAYITARSYLAVSAANVAGVVTLTTKSKGARQNDLIVWQDTAALPSGATSALAGGSAVGNGGVRFSTGSGTEDVTTLLATLYTGRYHRIGAAQLDASNLALWKAQLDNKAGPFENRMEHIVFASNTTLNTTTSRAQTTLNEQRAQMLWMLDAETPAPEIAAVFAAMRLQTERATPNVSYDRVVLPGVRPQTDEASIPNRATRVAALDVGITPLFTTTATGLVSIVRSITTRSQTDTGDPDDKTLDTSESVVPDYIRDDLRLFWLTDFLVNNPYVRDNRAPEEPPLEVGTATPDLWSAQVKSRLITVHQANKLNTRVVQNPPVSVFNKTAKRIASRVPVVVLPLQHQIEVSVEQVPYATAQ
jgi:phage tail sheath gpL-like